MICQSWIQSQVEFKDTTLISFVPSRELVTKKIDSFVEIRVTALLKIRMSPTRVDDTIGLFIIRPERLESENFTWGKSDGLERNDQGGMIRDPSRQMSNNGLTKQIDPIYSSKSTINTSENFA